MATDVAGGPVYRAGPRACIRCWPGFMDPGETMEAAVAPRRCSKRPAVPVGRVRNTLASQPLGCSRSSLMFRLPGERRWGATSRSTRSNWEDAHWVGRRGNVARVLAGDPSADATVRGEGAIAIFLIVNWACGTGCAEVQWRRTRQEGPDETSAHEDIEAPADHVFARVSDFAVLRADA